MMSSRGPSKLEAADLPPRQEGLGASDDGSKTISVSRASFASTPWYRLKNPRVVRVSRAFGGKDRHSKVCTIRGLRDRRVRLSVPTAIQLYDLQDRLGLSQPSKVVDWLLDAAKLEIDELPPLPVQPVHLGHPQFFHQYSSSPSTVSSSVGEMEMIDGISWSGGNNNDNLSKSSSRRKFMNNSGTLCHTKSNADCEDEENLGGIRRSDQGEKLQENRVQVSETSHSYNLPYGSNVYHMESSDIASFPRHHGLIASQSSYQNPQSPSIHHHIPCALPLSHTQPYFPVQFIASSGSEMDPRQVSHFQPKFMMTSCFQTFLPSSHELPLNSLSHDHNDQPSSVRAPFMSFDVNVGAVPTPSSHELPLNSLSHDHNDQPSSVRAPFMSFDVNVGAVPTRSRSSENEMDKD